MDDANRKIEQQMTVLLRRVQSIHLSTSAGDMHLERSAYGILCQLADEGPQRLGALATAFGLDPSTITRQVKALEDAGLAARETDPSDRRASILDLTAEGREALDTHSDAPARPVVRGDVRLEPRGAHRVRPPARAVQPRGRPVRAQES